MLQKVETDSACASIDAEPDKVEIVLDDAMFEYRNHLVLAGQKAQEDYDKAVMTLSGGALGISFAFLKDIVGPGDLLNETLLFLSWMCWGLSVTAVLFSYYFSHRALQCAIDRVDEGKGREPSPGGMSASVTSALNIIGGLLFLLGVIFMTWFIKSNLGAIDVRKETPTSTSTITRLAPEGRSGICSAQSTSYQATAAASKEVNERS